MPRRTAAVALACVIWTCPPCRAETKAEDAIEQFRARLADPAQFPLRRGLELDLEALQRAMDGFGSANAALLRERFESSLRELPEGQPPAAPQYTELLKFRDELLASTSPTGRYHFMLQPDVGRLAWLDVSMMLPLAMTQDLGMPTSALGGWIGFFNTARPQVRRCGQTERQVTLCLDYGGQDVFVVQLKPDGYAWVLEGASWWQSGRRQSP